jgi:MFS family permease
MLVLSVPNLRSEWRVGWRVVLAASIGVGFTYSLFILSAGLFIIPMQIEFGWTRRAVTLGPMVMVLSGFMNPVAGILVGRFGARRVAITGLLLLSCGYLALSAVPANKTVLYVVCAFVAVVGALTNVIAYSRAVATWFERHVGAALGLTMCGLVTGMLVPLVSHVVSTYGWREGYRSLAGLCLVALPFLIPWFHERPKSPLDEVTVTATSEVTDGTGVRAALGDWRLYTLITALGGAAMAVGGYISQLIPLLIGQGITMATAAGLASVFSVSIGLGRIAAGFLLDHANPTYVTATLLAVPAIGGLLLVAPVAGGKPFFLSAAAVCLIGLAQGAEADFLAYFIIRLFGLRSYSTLYGFLLGIISLSMASGGLLFAYAYDVFHNYLFAGYVSAAIFILCALLMLMIRVPPRPAIAP